jgi:hypothetical protein
MRRIKLTLLLLLATGLLRAEKTAFLTYAASPDQERAALILLRSLRAFGGSLARAPFFVARVDPRNWRPGALLKAGAALIAVPPAPGAPPYPFMAKVLALAAAEKQLQGKYRTVVYLDAETIILNEPSAWVLAAGKSVAIRPVHLVNQVGVGSDQPLDTYWNGIYQHLGGLPAARPPLRSLVDEQDIQPYYSCVIMAFDPALGLMAQWKKAALELMADKTFQETACQDQRHRIFLHQAVLSALLNLRLPPARIEVPGPLANYPMSLHNRVSAGLQPRSLDAVTCLYVDSLWQNRPDWWRELPAGEKIAAFLSQAQAEYQPAQLGLK